MTSDPVTRKRSDPSKMDNKSNLRLFFAMVAVVLAASVLASLIQTAGGRVRVHEIKIPTQYSSSVLISVILDTAGR